MSYEQNCVICGSNASLSDSQSFGFVNDCKQCGKIIFESDADDLIKGEDGLKFKACLYHYFRHHKEYGIYYISKEKHANGKAESITIDEIMSIYPRNLSERIDMILLNFVSIGRYVGAEIKIKPDPETYSHIFFTRNLDYAPAEKDSLLDMMEKQGLIRILNRLLDGTRLISIDYKGWQRVDEINKVNTLHGQGFIAMMFSEDMKEIQQAIEKAIYDAGYIPRIMNKLQHNGQVVPEMLYQIRMSDFLVADLTGNRGGVYFEAGYALGMKKEVIFTVNEDIVKKEEKLIQKNRINTPHFDVAQYNQVRYTCAEDLKTNLTERIISSIGDRRKL